MKKLFASLLPDALMTAGAGAISFGAWLIYKPAGFMVAGALLLAAGVLVSNVTGK